MTTSTISDNVVESAPRPHADGAALADGFSISCAHTLIEGNQINDISATGIVYFGGPGTTIRNNVITEDHDQRRLGDQRRRRRRPRPHGRGHREQPDLASSPRYLHVGIAVGLHVWGKSATISGVTVRGNHLGA